MAHNKIPATSLERALQLLKKYGLAFSADSKSGIIITVDDTERSGVIEFLCISKDRISAEQLESEFEDHLVSDVAKSTTSALTH
ncbi:peptide ligase PGM1-related protein [Pseudomonas sp. R3-56]|uniref:peptide ligase PGM1-related protein n=1 Tax=Pseudomonas sp. R3-56 TaxID=2817401 RepID=UPI003DA8458D